MIALTINVEEAPQRARPAEVDARAAPSRGVEAHVERVLAWLEEHEARATLFVMGATAERYPGMVRRIVASGNELGCYGYEGLGTIDRGDGPLLADMRLGKAILEDVTGGAVAGCRIPGLAVGAGTAWALDCLHLAGFRYSSSTTARVPRDGYPASPIALELKAGFYEVPVTLVRAMGFTWPAGGGEALRRLPYWLWRRQLDASAPRGATFVFDAGEFERAPSLPRRQGPDEFEGEGSYLGRTDARIRRLLHDFGGERIDALLPVAAPR